MAARKESIGSIVMVSVLIGRPNAAERSAAWWKSSMASDTVMAHGSSAFPRISQATSSTTTGELATGAEAPSRSAEGQAVTGEGQGGQRRPGRLGRRMVSVSELQPGQSRKRRQRAEPACFGDGDATGCVVPRKCVAVTDLGELATLLLARRDEHPC